MPLSHQHGATGLDDAQAIRHADGELLSLALIDARNVSLRWLSALEELGLLHAPLPGRGITPLAHLAHAAWYQERWIARNVMRQRGEAADATMPAMASVWPGVDEWMQQHTVHASLGADASPAHADGASGELRSYMADTLDSTLELLCAAEPSDMGLYFWRAALLHEDRTANALAEHAAAEQWKVQLAPLTARVDREPIWMPSQRMHMGSPRGGLVPENERWAHEVALPEFEIDSQVVDWARFIPFAEDGGYDRPELWSEAGWRWAQAVERRAPRHVEQLRGGAVLMRQGRLARAPAGQPVVHVSRHEAEAWCRWAGRRLPTEPEWELAACTAASRGFVWGDVFEWVAGSARAWPAHAPTVDGLDALPKPSARVDAPRHGVLRGASWLARGRMHHPRGRRFMAVDDDLGAWGFRSCSM